MAGSAGWWEQGIHHVDRLEDWVVEHAEHERLTYARCDAHHAALRAKRYDLHSSPWETDTVQADRTPSASNWRPAVLLLIVVAAVAAGALILGQGTGDGPEEQHDAVTHDDTAVEIVENALAAEEDECGPVDPDHPPRLELNLTGGELAFGEVFQGVDVERTVSFENAGEGPLCIRHVVSGCGCAQARLLSEETRFESGMVGRVAVRLDSRGREGPLRKKVSLVTNEPGRPLVSFTITADIRVGIASEEPNVDFGRQAPDTPAEATITLRGPSDHPWTVTGVEGGVRGADADATAYTWTVEVVETEPARILRLKLTHPGREALGLYRDSLVLRLDYPQQDMLRIPSALSVTGRITSRRAGAHLGLVAPGQEGLPSRMRLEPGRSELRFAVLEAYVVPAGADPEGPERQAGFGVRFDQDPPDWWVEVWYDGSVETEGPLAGDLIVRTDDAEQPLVRLAVDVNLSHDVRPRRPPRRPR